MSKLPVKALPTEDVVIEGVTVSVRGLSRSEAMHFSTAYTEEAMADTTLGDRADQAEVYLLVKGTGVTEEEAQEWRDTTDVETVGGVVDLIVALSGLSDALNGKDADPK